MYTIKPSHYNFDLLAISVIHKNVPAFSRLAYTYTKIGNHLLSFYRQLKHKCLQVHPQEIHFGK